VRGRRPRPLDECAVPRQRSRSLLPLADEEQRPGRRPLSCARLSDGRSESLVRRVDCEDARMKLQGCETSAREGRPGVLRPERRASHACPSPFAVLPSRGDSRRPSGTPALISHARRAMQHTEVEGLPSPKFGVRVDAGLARTETVRRPAGSATSTRPTQRAAIVLRRGSPFARSGQSSAETAKATPKPSVVARPTALPPRR
jgi:hypothetical protein